MYGDSLVREVIDKKSKLSEFQNLQVADLMEMHP